MSSRESFLLTVVLAGRQQTGGGYHQALTNLRMLLTSLPDEISITIVDVRGSFVDDIQTLREEGLLDRATVVPIPKKLSSLRDRILTESGLLYRIARALLALIGKKVGTSVVARFLDTSSCDLVYFTSPSPDAADLMVKPFVWTLWDLCHLDSPEFPEIRTSGKFEAREEFNSRAIRKAAFVVVDSPELVSKAARYFAVSENKFVVIPFTPPSARARDSCATDHLPSEVKALVGKYFFYPAQLWTHKNHLRIVEAMTELDALNNDIHAVFVGKDHGAGAAIQRGVERLGMSQRVHFLGYVDDRAIPALYAHSIALVMASYFGPTNIPPLEAMLLETPVIASDVHLEQLGPAALFFNPDDALELAQRMREANRPSVRKRLIAEGAKRLHGLDLLRAAGEVELSERIMRLSHRILRS